MSLGAQLIEAAVEALKAGDKIMASTLLLRALNEDRNNANIWYYLALVQSTINEGKRCLLKSLEIDPKHAKAQRLLSKIELAKARPTARMLPATGPLNAADEAPTEVSRPLELIRQLRLTTQ